MVGFSFTFNKSWQKNKNQQHIHVGRRFSCYTVIKEPGCNLVEAVNWDLV